MAKLGMTEQVRKDIEWGHDHLFELSKQYGTVWVAIGNKHVVAASMDLAEVERLAQETTGRDDCPVLFVERGARVYST